MVHKIRRNDDVNWLMFIQILLYNLSHNLQTIRDHKNIVGCCR